MTLCTGATVTKMVTGWQLRKRVGKQIAQRVAGSRFGRIQPLINHAAYGDLKHGGEVWVAGRQMVELAVGCEQQIKSN
jgi:hypothetical protein